MQAALRRSDGAAGADRRPRRPRRKLAVAPDVLERDLGHLERPLRVLVFAPEVGRPADPGLVAPLAQDLVGGAEAGARVDHRGAADGAADRQRDRRATLGDRQAAVAVEEGERLERVGGVGLAVEVLARLEHDHVEPGLRQPRRGDCAAGARADDHHVALLAVALRVEVGEAAVLRLRRSRPHLAARLVADHRADALVAGVADHGQGLGEQQQVAVEREARALELGEVLLARLEPHAAEAPRERQPLEGE